jgi:type I restriction enzyme M protein
MKTIADPACGTGGFFLAAYDYIAAQTLDKEQKQFLKYKTFYGNEIVAGTRRMALMNLFLHNIGDIDSDNFISPADALIADNGERFDYILANPPFGKKSSQTL